MKVSIIIPTYQRPRMLQEALRSVAAVRAPPGGYEVIVVNDGGRGVNRKLVRRWWPGRQETLSYASIEHAGFSAAMNRGLKMARGEYWTFCADDDTVLPNKLEVLCPCLDAHQDAVAAYSLPRYFDERGSTIAAPKSLRSFLLSHPVVTWKHIERGDGLMVHGSSMLYRLPECRDVGGFDTNLPTGEEWEFHLRLLKLGYSFRAVDAVTTGYRVHDGCKSLTHRRDRSAMRQYINHKLASLDP